jgi:hypothetical protein
MSKKYVVKLQDYTGDHPLYVSPDPDLYTDNLRRAARFATREAADDAAALAQQAMTVWSTMEIIPMPVLEDGDSATGGDGHPTPGPWHVHMPTSTDHRLFVGHPEDERLICRIGEGSYHPYRGETPEAEQVANARLIAAAPDLLAALQEIAGEMATRFASFRKVAAIANKAIAKALGSE